MPSKVGENSLGTWGWHPSWRRLLAENPGRAEKGLARGSAARGDIQTAPAQVGDRHCQGLGTAMPSKVGENSLGTWGWHPSWRRLLAENPRRAEKGLARGSAAGGDIQTAPAQVGDRHCQGLGTAMPSKVGENSLGAAFVKTRVLPIGK